MNRRQEQLLNIVLRTPGLRVRELAAQLGVSERTIRNDIRDLPALTGGRGGVYASGSAQPVSEGKPGIPQDQEGRILWLVRQVLLDGGMPDFEAACEQLAVSPSTLKTDIMMLNRRMEGSGCRIRLRQKRITCCAQESQVRQALRQIIRQATPEAFVHPSFLKNVFDPELVDAVEEAVSAWLQQTRRDPNDLLRLALIQHATLIAARNPAGSPVHEGLAGILEAACGRRFCEEDAAACFQMESQAAGTSHVSGEVCGFVEEAVSHLEARYAVGLDRSSFEPLFSVHLEQLLGRCRAHRNQENPLAASIRQSSPFVFDMAADVAGLFEKRFGMPLQEAEIAFFALHIGSSLALEAVRPQVQVVCPEYHGLRQSFLQALETEFGTRAAFKPVKAAQADPDGLLVSAIPLDIPHIRVAPFPGPEDFGRIRQALEAWHLRDVAADIDRLFAKTRFLAAGQDGCGHDRQSVIGCLCALLEADGLVDQSLCSLVLKREQIVSTAYGDFAVPHALAPEASSSGVAVALFPEGLDWGPDRVHAVFLMQLAGQDSLLFERFYNPFIRLLQQPQVLQTLLETSDFPAFRRELLQAWHRSR